MDDGTRYRVSTKKLELEKAKSCTLVLYYEATIKGKNKLHQIDVADADTKRAALELMLASSASVVSLAKKMTKPNTKTVTRTVSIPKK